MSDKTEMIVAHVTVNNQFSALGENKTHFKLKPNKVHKPFDQPYTHTQHTLKQIYVSRFPGHREERSIVPFHLACLKY